MEPNARDKNEILYSRHSFPTAAPLLAGPREGTLAVQLSCTTLTKCEYRGETQIGHGGGTEIVRLCGINITLGTTNK